jgi:hypothetical protein
MFAASKQQLNGFEGIETTGADALDIFDISSYHSQPVRLSCRRQQGINHRKASASSEPTLVLRDLLVHWQDPFAE